MANPQQPELDPTASPGPVPPENQAGHHPESEQDKPNLDAFAQRLGIADGPSVAPIPGGKASRSKSGVFAGVAAALTIVILVVARIKKRRR